MQDNNQQKPVVPQSVTAVPPKPQPATGFVSKIIIGIALISIAMLIAPAFLVADIMTMASGDVVFSVLVIVISLVVLVGLITKGTMLILSGLRKK
mgnify:CR=1 FL=1